MGYIDLSQPYLKFYGLSSANETPTLNETINSAKGNSLSLGFGAINNVDKRLWVGMGRYQSPVELPTVIILKQSGQTPSTSTIYNAGTIIINTVDNKAWVGTGNASTEGSFISISPSAADNADIDGGEFSLDGGTF